MYFDQQAVFCFWFIVTVAAGSVEVIQADRPSRLTNQKEREGRRDGEVGGREAAVGGTTERKGEGERMEISSDMKYLEKLI